MKDVWTDIRFAARGLRAQHRLSILIVLILAVGIGANTAIFTVIHATLLRPLPYHEPDRLVMVWETSAQTDRLGASAANIFDWRRANRSFEDLAGFDMYPVTLSGHGEATRYDSGSVTEGFFRILRAELSLGRDFTADEFTPGSSDVVILSNDVWKERFGADASILGQEVTIDGTPRTVVGVLGPDFRFVARDADLWIPLALDSEQRSDRKYHWANVVARLRADVSLEQAQADLSAIAARLELEYPEWMKGVGVRVVRLREDVMRPSRESLLLMMGAVGLVLLIASANVASLLVARGVARAPEMALRSALGAGRFRLVRLLLVESLLLGSLGGAVGLFLGWLGITITLRLMNLDLPRIEEVSLDGNAAFFALLVAFVTALGFGVLPARHALRRSSSGALSGSARQRMSLQRAGSQRWLVISEVAISVVLLMGTGLLLGSLWRILRVDPGFDPANKLAMVLILPLGTYPDVEDQNRFFDRVMDSIGALPGVRSVDSTTSLPLNPPAGRTQTVFVEGRPLPPPGEQPLGIAQRFVTPGYFRTMGIRLLRGRVFDSRDRNAAPGVLVVNEAMAEQVWPGEDPIGQRVAFERGGVYREVIGVVSSTTGARLDEPPPPAMYAPPWQRLDAPISWAFIVVSTEAESTPWIAPVRDRVRAADPDFSIYRIRTLHDELSATVADRRSGLVVLGMFTLAALWLASVGVYSVLRHDVTRRTREIGVRMALGATTRDVAKLVVREGMTPVGLGLVAGAVSGLALTRWIQSMLFRTGAMDPLTLGAVCIILTAAALAACYLPAQSAAKTSPAESMRHE